MWCRIVNSTTYLLLNSGERLLHCIAHLRCLSCPVICVPRVSEIHYWLLLLCLIRFQFYHCFLNNILYTPTVPLLHKLSVLWLISMVDATYKKVAFQSLRHFEMSHPGILLYVFSFLHFTLRQEISKKHHMRPSRWAIQMEKHQ